MKVGYLFNYPIQQMRRDNTLFKTSVLVEVISINDNIKCKPLCEVIDPITGVTIISKTSIININKQFFNY